jgi:uncharacterized membrane protein
MNSLGDAFLEIIILFLIIVSLFILAPECNNHKSKKDEIQSACKKILKQKEIIANYDLKIKKFKIKDKNLSKIFY